jgi:predicted O-methyltransferase YrrM
MAARAKANFEKAGLVRQIDIVVGDAEDKLAEMTDVFDFIFLDIDKVYYEPALTHCHRLLKQGGLLVADNVGFKDADSFNRLIYESPGWQSVSIFAYLPFHSPERDGLCLAVRC